MGPSYVLSRRRFIVAASSLVLAGCGPSTVPKPRPPYRIGVLTSGPVLAPDNELLVAFREGFADNGLQLADVVFEYRFADGRYDRLPELARELVGLDVHVIVAQTTAPAQAALSVTKAVPIVMVSSHDPVAAGIVTNLARPGGNVTGQTLMGGELMPKQLEVLKEVVPSLRSVAYLTPVAPAAAAGFPSVTDVFLDGMRAAAAAAGLRLHVVNVPETADFEAATAVIARDLPEALFVIESPFWGTQLGGRPLLARIVEIAGRQRLPSISGLPLYAERGLLISYGNAASQADLFRSAARYVVKILDGARPADLPVEQPTKLALVLNLKAAQAIGITFPSALLARADRVIR